MPDTDAHRSSRKPVWRDGRTLVWLAVHVYAFVCLAAVAELSAFRALGILCPLQFIVLPALLIYVLITHLELSRGGKFGAAGSVIFVSVALAYWAGHSSFSNTPLALGAEYVLVVGIFSPIVIVPALLIYNVFAAFGLLVEERLISAASVLAVSVALACLTFSPKEWMWREMPWALYYAAADQFRSSGDVEKSPTSIRRIRSQFDDLAAIGGSSCHTELFHFAKYTSRKDLSMEIAKLENFPMPDEVDLKTWGLVERAKNIASSYVLAYTCY